MKNSQKGFVISLVIVIIAVLLAGAGVYYFRYKCRLCLLSNNYIVSLPNITEDWKTYTNTQYGFEFQYPSYAKVIDEGTDQIGASLSLVVLAGNERNASSDEVTIRVYEVESGTELYNEFQDNGDIKIVRGKDFIIQVNPTTRNNSELSDMVKASIKVD